MNINGSCGAGITIILGSVVENLSVISSSFHHACKLLNQKFILGSKGIISDRSDRIEDTNISGEDENVRLGYSLEHIVSSLFKAIDAGDIEQIKNVMDGVFRNFYLMGIMKM